jgi:hypothetical protein
MHYRKKQQRQLPENIGGFSSVDGNALRNCETAIGGFQSSCRTKIFLLSIKRWVNNTCQ